MFTEALRARVSLSALLQLLPGLLLSAAIALVATAGSEAVGASLPVPSIVLALLFGLFLYPIAAQPIFAPGLRFCVKRLLRWAVALLGARIGLGEILGIGATALVLVVLSMALTILSGLILARVLGLTNSFGAISGAATAVCGASAALATSSVLPDYRGKDADVAFVVLGVNALSTLALVLYPILCRAIGFNDTQTGIMLGATIHDVAQVAGAGYGVSDLAGNAAVIVKLFRVLLLLPVLVFIGWLFLRPKPPFSALRASVPGFIVAFLVLCAFNSIIAETAMANTVTYHTAKALLSHASYWGLLIAISALGLGTSLLALTTLGWRYVVLLTGTTTIILVSVLSLQWVTGSS